MKGRVTNRSLEPLSFVTVQLKNQQIGTRTNDKGEFEFQLEEGEYDILFSLLGYEKKSIKLLHKKNTSPERIILDESSNDLNEVKIINFKKDKAEEIIRNVIQQKHRINSKASNFSVNVYIRATQENETTLKQKKKKKQTSITDSAALAAYNKLLDQMSMSEVALQVSATYPNKIKETRMAVKNRGITESLFFLTTTDGEFNLYDNLMKVPALAQVPFLSPISYSGLIAYQYKTVGIKKTSTTTIYTIKFTPGKLSNALLEGEVQIVDSSWTILKATYTFPKYHMTEYDYFEVEQDFDFIENKSWLPIRQEFSYLTKSGNNKTSGRTIAIYNNYKIDTVFPKKIFNNELSSTALEAYEKDSNFWNAARKEPLTNKELQFINRKDSIYRATNSKQYLDSIDKMDNKITWKKLLLFGVSNYNREKERTLFFAPAISVYRPLLPGGTRFGYTLGYRKISKAKKSLSINLDGSYGRRNNDLIGDLKIFRLYNPFSQGYYSIDAGRSFDLIFMGDALINLLRRSNFYRKDYLELEHGLELLNGLVLRNRVEFARRYSLAGLKLNTDADSIFKDSYFFNQPILFDSYNALFASITLEYTPFQKYLREPREKIILGSDYPTIYAKWRKGIPSILGSEINFDYIEFGLKQRLKLGLAGISQYQIYTGEFTNQKNLRYIDYKFISRGNPYLFNNPLRSFQSLDSTFPIFKRFYEGHYLHQFNGSLINKIPLIKKLNILEVAGGSFLILPERNLRFIEGFVGLEKVIRIWNERFKIGYYFVVSMANKYNNPYQFKIGLDQFNKRKNSWN